MSVESRWRVPFPSCRCQFFCPFLMIRNSIVKYTDLSCLSFSHHLSTLGDFTPPTRPSGETFYRRTSDRLQSQSSRASSLLHPPSSSSSSGTHAPGLVPLSETLQEHHLSPATHLATSLPSSVDVSSVSGHVTIGIFDEEPKDLFEGMTLSSLLKGLSNVGGELKKIWKA